MKITAVEIIKIKTVNQIIRDLPLLSFGTSSAKDIKQIREDRWYLDEAFRRPALVEIENLYLFFQSMSVIYQLEGKFEQVVEAGETYAELVEDYFGTEHEEYIDCLILFGAIHFEQGRYDEAEQALLDALSLTATLKKSSPPLEDPEFYESRIEQKLSLLYLKQARYKEAEQIFQTQLQRRKVFNENPSSELANLAILYTRQGRYQEAETTALEALGFAETVGDTNPHIAAIIQNLMVIYSEQKRYQEAEVLQREVLERRIKTHGKKHPIVASAYTSLAILLRQRGHFDEAKELHLKALDIRRESLGEHHPDTASVLNNLGALYHAARDYAEAEKVYLQALYIREKSLGEHHPDTATTISNLGVVLADQSRFQEAEELYRKALQIRRETLGSKHPDIQQTIRNIEKLYQRMESL